ncbi:thioesterase II family protein [Streptomyces sp. NPDC001348]
MADRTRPGGRENNWVIGRLAAGEPTARVVCLPQAGGGAGAFSLWRPHLPQGLEMVPVELPGRGTRRTEPLSTDLEDLVEALLRGLSGEFDRPYALFGHSFGGLLAYELALRILRPGVLRRPEAVLVSAARAPHTRTPGAALHEKSDEELLRWLVGTGGMPESLLRHTAYVRTVLSAVRADLTLAAHHHRREPAVLDCPLYVFGGQDDPVVRPEDLEEWDACADSGAVITLCPGDHFYLYTGPAELLRHIGSLLGAATRPEGMTEV